MLIAGLLIILLVADFALSIARNNPPFSVSFTIISKAIARTVGVIETRSGYLATNTQIRAELAHNLRPLDVILVATPFKGTSMFSPGRHSHVAIWMGTAKDWRQAGWDQKSGLSSLYEAVLEGKSVVQSDAKGVTTITLDKLLNTDEVTIFRANHLKNHEFHFDRIAENMGKAYDYNLDDRDQDRLICTEFVTCIFPCMPVRRVKRFWRHFILPDELQRDLEQASHWQHWLHISSANEKKSERSSLHAKLGSESTGT